MVLPAVSLGFNQSALIARIARSCMVEVLQQDYIRTARAKGVVERRVVLSHGLRNAILPVVTVIGLTLGALLSGAVLTETIFGLTGIGLTITQSILGRDYPVIQAVTLITAILYITVNLIVDVSYAFLDPRIRLE
jgi:peptide/nickel transport system permease protein